MVRMCDFSRQGVFPRRSAPLHIAQAPPNTGHKRTVRTRFGNTPKAQVYAVAAARNLRSAATFQSFAEVLGYGLVRITAPELGQECIGLLTAALPPKSCNARCPAVGWRPCELADKRGDGAVGRRRITECSALRLNSSGWALRRASELRYRVIGGRGRRSLVAAHLRFLLRS
jgi:hypothetical protein